MKRTVSGHKIICGLSQALEHTKTTVHRVKVNKVDEFCMHEAMHMTSFLVSAIYMELCEHEAISSNKKWSALADKAHDALSDLYQAIAKVHLGSKK